MTDQDNYSDIQQEVPRSADVEPGPENVYRDHKATISNPNKLRRPRFLESRLLDTSQAAKEHSRKVLENEASESVNALNNVRGVRGDAKSQGEQKDSGNVARGLKASINNQNVRDEAREKAKEILRNLE